MPKTKNTIRNNANIQFMSYFNENFLYLLHYQVNKENLEILADFVERNKLFILWRLPYSSDWFSYSDDQHNARLTLDRIFALPRQKLWNFNNAYFLLEQIWNFASKELKDKDILFLYSYVYNSKLNVSFSGIVWKGNKIILGSNVFFTFHITSFLQFCRDLELDFAFQIKDKFLQEKVEVLISYFL